MMNNSIEPRTLTEAVNLGKVYGIDTAETILALAISNTIKNYNCTANLFLLNSLRKEFKKLSSEYKSQLTKPVTEEKSNQQ